MPLGITAVPVFDPKIKTLAYEQKARTLEISFIFTGKRFLIHDRDPLYTAEFLGILAGAGVQSVKLPPRSPNLNAYAERFVRTIREDCLEQMISCRRRMHRR